MWKTESGKDELTADNWKEAVSELCGLFGNHGEIVLSGGEPLLKEGIFDLIDFCKKKGLKTIMPSNAFLINEETAKLISESGLDQISISLDSYREETHDFIRGVRGAHKRVLDAVDNLRKFSGALRIEIITVISGVNMGEIIDHVEWVKQRGNIDSLYFQTIARPFFSSADKYWHNSEEFNFLWPKDMAEMRRIMDNLVQLRERTGMISNSASQLKLFKSYFENPDKRVGVKKCRLGDFVINIDQAGNIFLCCFDKPIGNIKKDDINTLWYSQEAERARDRMHSCALACNNIVNCFFKEDQ